MTGKELINQIRALGFEGDVDSTDRLYSLITLAIRMIAAQFPHVMTAEVEKKAGEEMTVCCENIENCAALASIPVLQNGGAVSVRVSDGCAVIPRDASGVFTVRYVEGTPEFTDASLDTSVHLHPLALHLLPLLAAGLVWQDDEPQKSELYLRQYAEGVRLLTQRGVGNGITVRTDNGW